MALAVAAMVGAGATGCRQNKVETAPALDPATLGAIQIPVMIVVGTKDELVGSAEPLAGAIAGAELVKLEGRDHLNAPGDKRYKEAVARFFAAAPA